MPLDWDEQNPWSSCFKILAKDEPFWSEQAGAPLAPSEDIASTHLVGGSDVLQVPKEEKDDRKRQANRDKRYARRKRLQDDREELRKLKSQKFDADKPQGKGQNKGKSKDKTGAEICFSWAQAKGLCADVPVGGECRGKVRRAHKCMMSKKQRKEKENDFFLGGMRNPDIAVSKLHMVTSVGMDISRAWNRFIQDNPKALGISKTYMVARTVRRTWT